MWGLLSHAYLGNMYSHDYGDEEHLGLLPGLFFLRWSCGLPPEAFGEAVDRYSHDYGDEVHVVCLMDRHVCIYV